MRVAFKQFNFDVDQGFGVSNSQGAKCLASRPLTRTHQEDQLAREGLGSAVAPGEHQAGASLSLLEEEDVWWLRAAQTLRTT